MAKRFIDTGLFDDEWFAELDQDGKIFWIYYVTKCDHAGLLKYNKKLIEFQTGIKSLERVIELFGKRLVRVKEELLFCPKFISFQYPGFPKSGVKQQDGAISLLVSAGLWDTKHNCYISLTKVLPKTYVNEYDNGIVNEYDNGSEKLKIDFWKKAIKSDEYWCEVAQMNHKGKDLDKAIAESFLHASSDKNRLVKMDIGDFKKLLNTWLSNTKSDRTKPNASNGKLVQ